MNLPLSDPLRHAAAAAIGAKNSCSDLNLGVRRMDPEQRKFDDIATEVESFVSVHQQGCLMQSPRWALVKPRWGRHLLLSRDAKGNLRGSMLVLTLADRGDGSSLLYAPRGPVCDPYDHETICELIFSVRELSGRFCHGEFKCDPLIEENDLKAVRALVDAGLEYTPQATFGQTSQPRQNAVRSDLAGLDEKTLFARLSYKTRYAIRRASEAGLRCTAEEGDSAFADFLQLYLETGRRQKFATRPADYLRGLLAAFGWDARLYLCRDALGRPLAGAIAVAFGPRLSYLYSGSVRTADDPGGGYLLQWELLRWALQAGCVFYDMGGICTDPQESFALFQLYQFKRKFAPAVNYAGEFHFRF